MNIRCPECETAFRVDPSRIPAAGVRARCSRCSAAFRITPDGLAGAPAQTAPSSGQAPEAAAPAAPSAPSIDSAPDGGTASNAAAASAPTTAATPSEAPRPVTPQPGPTYNAPPARPAPAPASAPAAPPPAAAAPAGDPRTPVFGSRDPDARAQRIARALVSDIVAYHPKRRDACLAAGTLRAEFRDEIMKSWEEYVAQVGLETAKGTPHFRTALNAILANGQNIF